MSSESSHQALPDRGNDASNLALPDAQHRLLRDRFLHFQSPEAYQQMRDKLLPLVTEWRWASDEMASPLPHYKKFFPGGRWLKKDGDPNDDYHHGFDAEGRIQIIDGYHCLLFDYRDGLIETIRFDHVEPRAIYVRHLFSDADGRVARAIVIRSDGGGDSSYQWEDGRLMRIVNWHWKFEELLLPNEPWKENRKDAFRTASEFSYSEDGEVEQILLTYPDSGYSNVEYRRKKKGETVKALTKEIEKRLLTCIPERLKELKPASPVYAVFLTYSSSGWENQPLLIVATEADRERVGLGNQWYIGELAIEFTDPEDSELDNRWGLYYQLMAEAQNFSPCVNMLRRVARRLNDEKLSSWLKATEDIIITAADSSIAGVNEDDLKYSLPEERFRQINFSEAE